MSEHTPSVVHLPYGERTLLLHLPPGSLVLARPPARALPDPAGALAAALDQPLGTLPLAELARGRPSACIVVSDLTRPVPNRLLLPGILERLGQAGIPDERIELLVATGTHRPQTPAEVAQLVGPELVRRCRVRNHDCRDGGALLALGTTSGGIPVAVDAGYWRAGLKVLTGFIEPHLMAGWSGGRKAVCPGICGLETTKAFHAAPLLAHPRAVNGVLEGNPVHEQALEAARLAGADFIVNVTLDEERRPTGIFAGELDQAHRAGVARARAECLAPFAGPADVAVTTCAGYPLDATLYQAIKGLAAALPVVRAGGALVMAASCQEGLGSPDFAQALADFTPQDFERALHRPGCYRFEQWQLQWLCRAARHARLLLVSERGPELAAAQANGWLQVCPTPAAALELAVRQAGTRVIAMPAGPYLLPWACQPE
jgi:nickel-dependent lactate racemase